MAEGLLILGAVVSIVLLLNFLFIIIVVFFEWRDPSASLAWIMALVIFPIGGFILYLVLGQSFSKQRIFRIKREEDRRLQEIVEAQIPELTREGTCLQPDERLSEGLKSMILLLLRSNNAFVSSNNRVEVFLDGTEKFASLLAEIRTATDSIHLEYFIWKDDGLGNEMRSALTERAGAGVEVRLLLDGVGCAALPRHFFDEFRSAGGKVVVFFPSYLRYFNLRYNYRNHRKIAVIDGKTGYIGGFNIGDAYLGLDPVWGYWRDCAVRIEGDAVLAAQLRFFLDWNYAADEDRMEPGPRYFPTNPAVPGTLVQVVSGGPDTAFSPVKEEYLRMIALAKKTVYLQTPYFIPDESVIDALRMAALSGVDVRIMIPDRPDHVFVFWAGISYIRQLLDGGIRAYTYDNGFIHAKTIVVDECVASVGSANWDVRSFGLNFETNAVLYDPSIARFLTEAFLRDLDACTPITVERLDALPRSKKVRQSIDRLFSPML
jgi:cardiolipin synthase A/B